MRASQAHSCWAVLAKLIVFFENVEGVAAMKLHADRAENGAHRTGGAALLADHLAYILRRDAEAEDGVFIPADRLDLDGGRLVDQGLRNLADQLGD